MRAFRLLTNQLFDLTMMLMENVPSASTESASETKGPQAIEPWWKRISGTFASDPIYREAMDLERQYREGEAPQADEEESVS